MVAPKVRRVRVSTRLSTPLRERLIKHCAASGLSERAVIEDAVRQYLDGSGDRTTFLKRLDRIDEAMARDHHDLELFSAAFGFYLRQWFAAHKPLEPEPGQPATRRPGELSYKRFLEHLGEQFLGGHRFMDDLPKGETVYDDELASDPAVVTTSHPPRRR
jgi:hypothetical protein